MTRLFSIALLMLVCVLGAGAQEMQNPGGDRVTIEGHGTDPGIGGIDAQGRGRHTPKVVSRDSKGTPSGGSIGQARLP